MTDTISARLVDNARRGGYEQPNGRLVITLADHINALAKTIKALVEALEPIENDARAPKIKKLVWLAHPYGTIARTGFLGAYYLISEYEKANPYFMSWPESGTRPEITSVEEGKAVAQADYEARWLAALDTSAAITPDKEAS